MADMGWIMWVVVALVAIGVVVMLMRGRKPANILPGEAPVMVETPASPAAVAPAIDLPAAPFVTTAPPMPAPAPEPVSPVEPVVAADPTAPIEAVAPAKPAEPVETGADNLLRLKGVGPKLAALLNSEGVTRYAQIAQWTEADLAAIDAKLGSFAGRPKRDNWIEQARLLAAGDIAGYEAKYGKL